MNNDKTSDDYIVPGVSPLVKTQPTDTTVGSDLAVVAVNTDGNSSYQWYKLVPVTGSNRGVIDRWLAVAGETAATYTTDHAGTFRVKIYTLRGGQSVSESAVVTVAP